MDAVALALAGNVKMVRDSWATMPVVSSLTTAKRTADSIGNVVYIAGGYDGTAFATNLEAFDASTKTISSKASMLAAGGYSIGLNALSGLLYRNGGGNGYSTDFEVYDPSTNTWTAKAAVFTTGNGQCSAAINGKVYVAGGFNSSSRLATTSEYNPSTNTWTAKANMLAARSGMCLGNSALNGLMYAIAGSTGGNGVTTVEAYDPIANTWSTKASINHGRSDGEVCQLNGKLYIGGSGGIGIQSMIEEYDPTTNQWHDIVPLDSGMSNVAMASANGKIYIVGGSVGGSYSNAIDELTLGYVAGIDVLKGWLAAN